jgi:hypothetical protein
MAAAARIQTARDLSAADGNVDVGEAVRSNLQHGGAERETGDRLVDHSDHRFEAPVRLDGHREVDQWLISVNVQGAHDS